jgi:hypothetical protein
MPRCETATKFVFFVSVAALNLVAIVTFAIFVSHNVVPFEALTLRDLLG